MTSKERMLTALTGGRPDRLPVTTHHVMPYFLKRYMGGMSEREFFDHFGLDAIRWAVPHRPHESAGEYPDPEQGDVGFLESRRVSSDDWRVHAEKVAGQERPTTRYRFVTPGGELSMVLQSDEWTNWVVEPLIKRRSDVDLIGKYVTAPRCDVQAVNRVAEEFGDRGIVRGHVTCFDVFGQPGTWQDAACLMGTEKLILAAFDDPPWVHELLGILQRRKKVLLQSTKGAAYDILELGGGTASSTVISPRLFDQYVAPYDAELIAVAHQVGQRIAYHTCGGMMPLLERIAAMKPDAMETFTPPRMGGDADLAEAKRRIGDTVCMIGGLDQFHFFQGCSAADTRAEVRRCFQAAGAGGRYILSPSDHFFDADPALIAAYADEARRCLY